MCVQVQTLHCGMLGSHKEKDCWKVFPHLKGAGKRGREGERSRSRSQSRGRQKPRHDRSVERVPTNRVGEKDKSGSYRSDGFRPDNYGQGSNRNNKGYGEYYETYKTKEDRRSRPSSPVAGGSRETHTTRRVRPKLDFLQPQADSDEAFNDLRGSNQ